jgi:putative transposase
MSQSIAINPIHIVFSTKERSPFITTGIEDEVFKYISGICKEVSCPPIIVGGHEDHIHILCELSKNIAIADLLKQIKTSSSIWVKSHLKIGNFYWQTGYGSFAVAQEKIPLLKEYIANQRAHHQQLSFKDEYLVLLKKNNAPFDERYLWD